MKPRVFIGSSTAGLPIAYAIQQNLQYDAFCNVWNQGSFNVSSFPLDDLLKAVTEFDFGIFVFVPEDVTNIRNTPYVIVRDNVIFEAGLFMGKLGKTQCFLVEPIGVQNFHKPSDLLGLTAATYDPNTLGTNPMPSLGPACGQIRNAMSSISLLKQKLIFRCKPNRGGKNAPLKLWIDLENPTMQSVVITSKHMSLGQALRPAANAPGDHIKREFQVSWSAAGNPPLNQGSVFLPHKSKISAWLPLDPTHTDTEVSDVIRASHCGEWHLEYNWLGPTPEYISQVEKL